MVLTLPPATEGRFSAAAVTRVVGALKGRTASATRRNWLAAVARRATAQRPDLAGALLEVIGVDPGGHDLLAGLSIGEVGVCYEALLAHLDRGGRRDAGQYFTPDDAAAFMAAHARDFPPGRWLDPCSGVGNLSWHLAAAHGDPARFIRDDLILIDRDPTALVSAVALIAADFAGPGEEGAVRALAGRAVARDFLARAPLPDHEFAILNPPYARAPARPGLRTGASRDLFAYFLERVVETSSGFIAVTPASYLSIPKFQSLRDCIDEGMGGGDVYVFDNVPDTLFRGYKFGSNNTSKTNFVRAAITVARPDAAEWRLTPILRWSTSSRPAMFAGAPALLSSRQLGPHGEWAKLPPELGGVWQELRSAPRTIADLLADGETPYGLTVATTPRYYISATYRPLDRRSKAVLHFRSAADRDTAAVVLNSSLPYLWWRVLDGGVSLPTRVLRSVPVPDLAVPVGDLASAIRASEEASVVTKLNAGRLNENVKHPAALVDRLNAAVIPAARGHLELVYSQNMFPLR